MEQLVGILVQEEETIILNSNSVQKECANGTPTPETEIWNILHAGPS